MRHSTRIAVGPVQFRIGSDWAAPIAALDRLYAGYPQDEARPADATVRLFAARPWRRWLRPSVHIGGDFVVPDALPLPLSMGLLAAEMGMNLQVALGWRRHMLLHASAVAKDGRALIMSGESGSGKSTLAALLGEGDWRLMGDEFTLIDPASGDALAFPRAVSLKNEAIAAVAARVDVARLGPLLAGTPKGDIRHLIPRADAIAAMHEPARPALLLFPRFGGEASIEPMGEGEAFVRLTEASTNYVALGEAGFAALTRLVRETPAFGISYPDGAAGIALVEQLWADAAR
ncbi:HprK-related kinase A [Sphingopyxis microcysteis]|uniref:HprK-related kinase A n=1 Tax=Sphingopyxis microcysteis TaxID=2484145 RepID=UPI001445B6E0|nr:HprK-related kinase A [Sphingopyxis microcysteis]